MAALAPILWILAWAVACGSADTAPSGGPGSWPSPERLLQESAGRMRALTTAHFTLEHEGDPSAQLFFGSVLELMEGRVEMPDKFSLRVEGVTAPPLPRTFIEISMVSDRGLVFMTNPINRDMWFQVTQGSLPFNFTDLGNSLAELSLAVVEPQLAGTGKADGVPSWRIAGSVSSEGLSSIVSMLESGLRVGLELWIGQEGLLLRKVRIVGPLYPRDQPDVVRVLTIDRFDEPVEISLPAQAGG